jgi:hypothetical protein
MKSNNDDMARFESFDMQEIMDEATMIACAVVVKRFRKLGWSRESVETKVPTIMERLRGVHDNLIEDIITDISNVLLGGGNADTVRIVSIAACVLHGVDVANDMERSRRAAAQ